MTPRKKAWASEIKAILDTYFPNPEIPLLHTSPYTLLIAVLLSAQATDKKVNQTTPTLFALADTPEKMVKIPVSKLEEILRPVGLFRTKAKAILGLSQRLLDDFSGEVPEDLALLETLPGVGHKTASVVMAQAFQVPTFPVDTHIKRCANRWELSSGKTPEQVEHDLKKLFPVSSWLKVHLQIIYFARAYCPALRHNRAACPICSKL
ncbi:MAG: endonuclease III [Verrucomicrobia bacterium]|nr:endonuclease III [Verrucomicrobiota bacterium]